jgi:dephospho-CoA kinase
MLRVGLTGGLGSGKSTVADILRSLGAHVLEADMIGRQLMEPGNQVYDAIVKSFGGGVVNGDGTLNRSRLAEMAFGQNRIGELNRIVHPPVIEEQQRWAEELFAKDLTAVAVVESALIFEADRQGTVPGWKKRFDRIILVTAPEEARVARYVARMRAQGKTRADEELEADARSRMAAQMPDSKKIPLADFVVENNGSMEETRTQVERIYAELVAAARV